MMCIKEQSKGPGDRQIIEIKQPMKEQRMAQIKQPIGEHIMACNKEQSKGPGDWQIKQLKRSQILRGCNSQRGP